MFGIKIAIGVPIKKMWFSYNLSITIIIFERGRTIITKYSVKDSPKKKWTYSI